MLELELLVELLLLLVDVGVGKVEVDSELLDLVDDEEELVVGSRVSVSTVLLGRVLELEVEVERIEELSMKIKGSRRQATFRPRC